MKTLKRVDLLLREVSDPYAQENFWRLRSVIQDLSSFGIVGPPGPQGPIGPPGPPATVVEKVGITFNTDLATQPTHFVVVNGANSVTKLTNNSVSSMPNGIFGVGLIKPSSLQITVLFMGIMAGYSGLTTGAPVFISTTATPTHTPPSTGIVQQIGFAVSQTEIMINL